MKNKITKLSLAFVLMMAFNVHAQTEQERQKIVSLSNTAKESELIEKKTLEYETNYAIAVAKANEKGLVLSGTNDRGQFFTIHSYDEASDTILYRLTFNNNGNSSSINTIKATYLHNIGMTGAGMIVGIWDGGIPRVTHQGLTPRVTQKDNGNVGMDNDGIFHGTHVGGTIASNGNGNLANTKGLAPQANLWAYNWSNDEAEMIAAAGQGLLVSNHSYGLDNYALKDAFGVGIFGRYTTTSRNIDIILNDYPFYTQVWAAGNDRDKVPALNSGYGGRDILANEGVSKNNIIVAAINGISTYNSASNVTMSSFSNWGPTDDFRIKPDISSKGVNVLSLSNQSNVATATSQGTSMASPSVTGGIAIWQQYYNSIFGNYMRSSTVRALMAHTALEAGPQMGPDYMYGWGVLNIEGGALVMENVEEEKAIISEETLTAGEVKEMTFSTTGGSSLIATIAWNDPAGTALDSGTNISSSRLVNDLDLRIINLDTDQSYTPYRLNRNWQQLAVNSTINSKGDNIADNIEKIEIVNAPAGNYKVVISHKGTTLSGGSQIYSFIMTGHQGTLSIEEEALKNVKVYPNPTQNIVTIDGDLAIMLGSELFVYDQAGRLIVNSILTNESDFNIDMTDFETGVYVFTLAKKGAVQTYKVVKK